MPATKLPPTSIPHFFIFVTVYYAGMFIPCAVCCIQMEWHAGKTLSQSVFTLLFVHHLPDINPEYLSPEEDEDPARPRWLITVVVRAAMLGLLKCCDLAWRELSKGRVQDVRPLPWPTEVSANASCAGRRLAGGEMRCFATGRGDFRSHCTFVGQRVRLGTTIRPAGGTS